MIKRLFDLFFSFFGLLFLAPVFLIISFLIKLDSNGPVLFRQERIGLNGNIFKIHKFRTMQLHADEKSRLTVGKDDRITQLGLFLRKYKIDELPQLIDVFIGKMSLVGPRPEVQEFINLYAFDTKNKVLSVRPGITDIASIEMLNETDILEKYDNPRQAYIDTILPMKQNYYLDYVENRTMWMDITIIFLTLKKLFKLVVT